VGSGKPRRKFIYRDDLADACIHPVALPDAELPMPLSYGGTVTWDTSEPDGMYQKRLDVERLAALGWAAKVPLEEGEEQRTGTS
jgi:GDP-L-fucose synthase